MGEQVNRIRLSQANEVYREDFSARYPVLKDSITLIHRYVVGTDFTSGDNLRLDLDGAQSVLFAAAKTPTNSFLTIVETDLATETGDSSRQGKSLTTGTSTTDVEIFVVYTI